MRFREHHEQIWFFGKESGIFFFFVCSFFALWQYVLQYYAIIPANITLSKKDETRLLGLLHAHKHDYYYHPN